MVRNGKLMFLGMSAFTGMLAVWSSLAGCQGSTSATTGDTSNAGGAGGTGSTTSSASNSGGNTSASSASSMTTTTTGSSMGTGGSTAQTATITEITKGTIGPAIEVQLKGVVAMSQKFLVSKGSSGSCLWGIMISEPNLAETKPNSGTLALSYGTNASIVGDGGTAFCPKLGTDVTGDAFPDDTQPGDVFDITGETAYFLLPQCATMAGGSTVPQYQVSKVKPGAAVRTSLKPGPVPAAHKLTAAELVQLGSSTDTAFHNMWGNVKVEIDNVVSEAQDNAGTPSITDKFGHILVHDAANMAPTEADKVQVGDKIYFRAYLKASNFCYAGPVYPDPVTTFTAMEGFNYLDFCTWNLQPNNKCSDLSPPSPDVKDCNGLATSCP